MHVNLLAAVTGLQEHALQQAAASTKQAAQLARMSGAGQAWPPAAAPLSADKDSVLFADADAGELLPPAGLGSSQ